MTVEEAKEIQAIVACFRDAIAFADDAPSVAVSPRLLSKLLAAFDGRELDSKRYAFVRDNFTRITRSPKSPASSKWSWGVLNGRSGMATWYDDAVTFDDFIDAALSGPRA
jgi:hypothetical protein